MSWLTLSHFSQILCITPWLMVTIRLSIALALLLDALDRSTETMFLPALVLAVALDIADGMVARRIGASSLLLRRADSFTDVILFYSVTIASFLIYDYLMKPFSSVIILVITLQLTSSAVAAIKYKALPAYHTWCSRFAGALLFLAAIQLFALHTANLLLMISLLAVTLSCIENISITLSLSRPTADVSGIYHALRLRDQYLRQPSS